MTDAEADKVAEIAANADGGCSVCVRYQTVQLMKAFPEHDWKSRMKALAIKNNEYWHDEVDRWHPEEW